MTTDLTRRDTHFEFGQNWADFSESVDAQRISAATDAVRKLTGDLAGKSFLDIGCGSGLSTLAALNLGAERVFGVDIDENSVVTTKRMLSRHRPDYNWRAEQLSVFDLDPLTHGTFDVVYSWGVLHHTGDMWRAIRHASTLLAPGGLFVIAIYTRTPLCSAWRRAKRIYSKAPIFIQSSARAMFTFAYLLALGATGTNPIRFVRDYRTKRGMKFTNDIHDWLGGYPYESASSVEIDQFLRGLGLSPVRSFPTLPKSGLFGTGCSEYIFRREN